MTTNRYLFTVPMAQENLKQASPVVTITLMPMCWESSIAIWEVWRASSRVGTMIIPCADKLLKFMRIAHHERYILRSNEYDLITTLNFYTCKSCKSCQSTEHSMAKKSIYNFRGNVFFGSRVFSSSPQQCCASGSGRIRNYLQVRIRIRFRIRI
jgi:hypothetical protein